MDLADIRELNRCRSRGDHEGVQATLSRMGDPTPEQLAATALEGLSDPDRNARVQMVRLLAAQLVPGAADGMRRALADPARRVRCLAAKLSVPFVDDPGVEARLREMAEDSEEAGKVRGAAFLALSSGHVLSSLASSPESARALFQDLPDLERYRQAALGVLVSLDPLSDTARDVLRHIVETGSREEAVAATRALCGFKVVNLGAIPPDERRRVAQTCEPARGRVFFWVPRQRA